jgi:hypothetical protein
MNSPRTLLWVVGAPLLSVMAMAVGCSSGGGSGTSCTPGEARACSCAGGGTGAQACLATGSYGACSCSGDDGGGADGAGTDGGDSCDGGRGPGCGDGGGIEDVGAWTPTCPEGGPLGFACACTTGSDCQSGDCFDFAAKGMKCTQPCSMPSDCPNPPDLGCSGMGQCKVP